MSILEIFERCLGDFLSVSWGYLIGVPEIFDGCPGDIYVSWRYLCVLEIFMCRGDIISVSWRYLIGDLEIFDRCPGDT